MTLDERIDHAWNAGLTLRKAFTFVQHKFPDVTKQQLIAGWRARKKEFGCACVRRPTRRMYDAEEREAAANATPVTLRMYGGSGTYGDWKGITGPGAMLRQMLEAERQKADVPIDD